MNNYVITNLPIKPRIKTKAGMLCTPLTIELLSKMLNAKSCLNYNILNSFDEKSNILDILKNDLTNWGYSFDEESEDTSWREKLLPHFEFMLKNGYIKEELREVAHCDCLRVEILKEKIKESHDTKIIEEREDGLYCKLCGNKINYTFEPVLIFNLDKDADDTLNIIPTRHSQSIHHFSKQFKGSCLMVSKLRKTGFEFTTPQRTYNIDIDFVLYQTPRLFNNDNVIIVNSDRQLCGLYLTNYINNIMGFKKPLFVAHPYIQDLNKEMDVTLKHPNNNFKKLALLFNYKWTDPTCVWKQNFVDQLLKKDDEFFENVYEFLPKIGTFSIDNIKSIEKALINSCNMSNNICALKNRNKTQV